ncbi:hypothetical protein Glove_586g37 [Diversispora epigaea]|uniref:DUF3835 domain-containing protein n=1 Tax=Diversispora epigaea TaxID=1348612 RepID=A0A397G9N0_9GLOM|nr:hypothetical protein Glove_586g37 [Diversispora epigaea]
MTRLNAVFKLIMEKPISESLLSSDSFRSKLEKVILTTYETLEIWKKYESDYNGLKEVLENLDQETEYKVMVPIGNLAFMPGKLIHTNEILAMLGENWFAERSAKQSIGIVERRTEMVRKTIKDLEIQLENQRTKIGLTTNVLGLNHTERLNEEGLPFVEIVEEVQENEIKENDQNKSNESQIHKIEIGESKQRISIEDERLFDSLIKDEEEELKHAETVDSDDEEDFEGSEDDSSEIEEEDRRENKRVTFADEVSRFGTAEYMSNKQTNRSITEIYENMLKKEQREQNDSVVDKISPEDVDFISPSNTSTKIKSSLKEGKKRATISSVGGIKENTSQNTKLRKNTAIKSVVREKETPQGGKDVDVDNMENEIWMKEIASEYHQKRFNLISQQSRFQDQQNPQSFEIDEKPKKVSRFKAARLQGQL